MKFSFIDSGLFIHAIRHFAWKVVYKTSEIIDDNGYAQALNLDSNTNNNNENFEWCYTDELGKSINLNFMTDFVKECRCSFIMSQILKKKESHL